MRRFYAPSEQFENQTVALDAEETKHLRDVLRGRAGARARVFDGAGGEFLCVVEAIGRRETRLRILEPVAPAAPESGLNLTLAVALLKGDKFDFVVQKAVELGVTTLVPLETRRGDVKLNDREKRIARWRKIALEACKQSGRARLMTVEPASDFEPFVETATGWRVLFSERGGAPFSEIEPAEKLVAVVGAEGGWEPSEIERARGNGFQIVTFGGRILRAETAAVAVAAILQHRFGDLK